VIICGDCLAEMAKMEPNSVDAIVTDPPYALTSASRNGSPRQNNPNTPHGRTRLGGGFMGKTWDAQLPGPEIWAEALRVAKPGCHLLAFGGTRTFHRLVCAIEDAGWEIRDRLGWLYGSGFPKNHDVSKAIDKAAGAERERHFAPTRSGNSERRGQGEQGSTYGDAHGGFHDESSPATEAARQWEGWGTALKPAWEPIIMARKPLDGTVAANVLKWGTGAINVDGCRVGIDDHDRSVIDHRSGGQAEDNTGKWQGPGIARQIGELYKSHAQGRWPANLIHDGSDEVLELFPQSSVTGKRSATSRANPVKGTPFFNGEHQVMCGSEYTDSGSAARFFYCAKSSRKEREMGCEGMEERTLSTMSGGEFKPDSSGGNHNTAGNPNHHVARNNHPTVKPLALMRYLCRLVTPPGGLILDPFMGSGSTLIAAGQEGFRAVGIEVNEEYCEIARKRIYGTLMEARP